MRDWFVNQAHRDMVEFISANARATSVSVSQAAGEDIYLMRFSILPQQAD